MDSLVKPLLIIGRYRHWTVSLAVLVSIFTGLWGCGIKAPPVPPNRPQVPPAVGLDYRLDGATLTLSWRLAAASESGSPVVDICRVYRAKTPLTDADCPNCPLTFDSVAEVPAAGTPGATLQWSENLQSGFGYTYKVVCATADGTTGEASDLVYVTY